MGHFKSYPLYPQNILGFRNTFFSLSNLNCIHRLFAIKHLWHGTNSINPKNCWLKFNFSSRPIKSLTTSHRTIPYTFNKKKFSYKITNKTELLFNLINNKYHPTQSNHTHLFTLLCAHSTSASFLFIALIHKTDWIFFYYFSIALSIDT